MLASSQVKPPVYVAFVLVLLVATLLQLCQAEGAEFESGGRISKRGPTVGLFAFPRVGRSDPEMALDWESSAMLPMETGDDYAEDYPMKEMKRQGLVPFPRVGRSGKSELAMAAARYWQAARNLQQQQSIVKRAGGSGANSGMWFGPRLGKRGRFGAVPVSSASSEQQQQQQQLVKGVDLYTPRLGRSLGEPIEHLDHR